MSSTISTAPWSTELLELDGAEELSGALLELEGTEELSGALLELEGTEELSGALLELAGTEELEGTEELSGALLELEGIEELSGTLELLGVTITPPSLLEDWPMLLLPPLSLEATDDSLATDETGASELLEEIGVTEDATLLITLDTARLLLCVGAALDEDLGLLLPPPPPQATSRLTVPASASLVKVMFNIRITFG